MNRSAVALNMAPFATAPVYWRRLGNGDETNCTGSEHGAAGPISVLPWGIGDRGDLALYIGQAALDEWQLFYRFCLVFEQLIPLGA